MDNSTVHTLLHLLVEVVHTRPTADLASLALHVPLIIPSGSAEQSGIEVMIVSHVALIQLIMLRIRMYVYISVTCDKTKQCKMQGPNEAVQQPMYVLLHPTSYIIAIALVYLSFVD